MSIEIFSLPTNLPPVPRWNGDVKKLMQEEAEHSELVRRRLVSMGFNGRNTGRVLRRPIADGEALYMVAQQGRKMVLVHLPYGDAYKDNALQYAPPGDILKMLDQQDHYDGLLQKVKIAA